MYDNNLYKVILLNSLWKFKGELISLARLVVLFIYLFIFVLFVSSFFFHFFSLHISNLGQPLA